MRFPTWTVVIIWLVFIIVLLAVVFATPAPRAGGEDELDPGTPARASILR